jgi:hypothetical protein
MGVHETGDDNTSGGVDHFGVSRWGGKIAGNGDDLIVSDQDVATGQIAG